MRKLVRSKGNDYIEMIEGLKRLPDACGAPLLSDAIDVLKKLIFRVRTLKLTKSQYVMFLLADMITWCEVGDALCNKAARVDGGERSPEFMQAAARLFVAEVIEKVYVDGLKIALGYDHDMAEELNGLKVLDLSQALNAHLKDMDLIASELVR